jgi:crotonobetainyl-CoA:carnitine CoA-transferase CaiB-like acyl-CoA transferase
MIAPYEGFKTLDGYLQLAAGNQQIYARLCEALEVPSLVDDPRFLTNADRVAHRDALHELLEARFLTRTSREWEETLLARQIPCSRVRTLDEVAADPQVAVLNMLPSVPHPAIPGAAGIRNLSSSAWNSAISKCRNPSTSRRPNR